MNHSQTNQLTSAIVGGSHSKIVMLIVFSLSWFLSVSFRQHAQGQTLLPDGQWVEQFTPAGNADIRLVPGDEVWLISTRNMRPFCEIETSFVAARYRNCQFEATTLDEFCLDVQTNPGLKTVIHVHGDFTDLDWALRRGGEVYNNSVAPVGNRPAVRFVIWAWKTERSTIPFKDFRVKVDRSVFESHRLRYVVQKSGLTHSIMIGYSMGAQVVIGAMNELAKSACGSNGDMGVAAYSGQLLITAPVLAGNFMPNQCCENAWDALVTHMAVITNQADRALKGAKRLNRVAGRFPGIDQNSLTCSLPIHPSKSESYESSWEVGKKHSIVRYSATSAFRCVMERWLQLAGNAPVDHAAPVGASE